MAPKKPTPIEHPPPHADPSSDEEEEEEVSNDEEEEDISDDEEKQPTPPQPGPKASTKSNPKPTSPDGSDDSGSDSEATPPDLTTKSLVTVAIPAPTHAVKSGKKRAADSKEYAKNFKKLKELDAVDVKAPAAGAEDEVKKQLFQRLFSEEDEIEVLKGMLDYKVKKGVDPIEDLSGFHKYVKDAIHVDVTSAQLSDKIRRLRKKYQKIASKSKKKGVERNFSRPHERLSYDLSKKIWGDGNVKEVAKDASVNGGFEVKSNGKGKRTPKPNMTPDQKEKHALSLQIPSAVKNEKEHVSRDSSSSSLCLSELMKSKDAAAMGLSEEFFKKGLELLGDEVKAELEEKWKGLVVAEAELYYRRTELTREQVKLTLDAYKASGR